MKHSSKTTRDRNTPDLLEELRAHIEYQQPNVNLYQFVGTLTVYPEDRREEPTTTSLGLDNILLRGCRLKDTDYIYGDSHILFLLIFYDLISIFRYLYRMRRLHWTRYEIRSQLSFDRD